MQPRTDVLLGPLGFRQVLTETSKIGQLLGLQQLPTGTSVLAYPVSRNHLATSAGLTETHSVRYGCLL